MKAVASSPPTELPSSPPPRLLDQVREAMHTRRYNARTEEIFTAWIRRFVLFHDKRHPDQMAEPEVVRFLSHLAVEQHVSPSAQTQARAALVFLYRHVLDRPLARLDGVIRAQRPVTTRRRGAGRSGPDRQELLAARPVRRT